LTGFRSGATLSASFPDDHDTGEERSRAEAFNRDSGICDNFQISGLGFRLADSNSPDFKSQIRDLNAGYPPKANQCGGGIVQQRKGQSRRALAGERSISLATASIANDCGEMIP
jgi:hypothetical protein